MKGALLSVAIAFGLWTSIAVATERLGPDEPQAKGPAELQGTWKLVSLETDGKSHDPVGGGQPRWVIKGEKVFYGGEEIAQLTADPTTTPRVIDLKFREPDRTYEGIYAVEKDTLKVCINTRSDAKDRPSKLATKDQAEWRLLVFEREETCADRSDRRAHGIRRLVASQRRRQQGCGREFAAEGQPRGQGRIQERRCHGEGRRHGRDRFADHGERRPTGETGLEARNPHQTRGQGKHDRGQSRRAAVPLRRGVGVTVLGILNRDLERSRIGATAPKCGRSRGADSVVVR